MGKLRRTIQSMRPSVVAWWATLRSRWQWGLWLVLYKIVADWAIEEVRTFVAGKSGVAVSVAEWVIATLPRITWMAIPFAVVYVFYRAYEDSAEYRQRLKRAEEEAEDFPKGFLDHLVDAQEAETELTRLMFGLLKHLHSISDRTTKVAETWKGGLKTPKQGLKLASKYASYLEKRTKKLERLIPSLKSNSRKFSEGYVGYFRWLSQQPSVDRQKLLEERKKVAGIMKNAKKMKLQLAELQESKTELKEASRDLHSSLARHDEAIDEVRDVAAEIHDTCVTILKLIDPKLGRGR